MSRQQTLLKILRLIKPYLSLFILSLLLAVIQVLCTLYIPALIGQGIDAIVGMGDVDMSRLYNRIIRMLLVIAFAGLSQWGMSILHNRIVYRMVMDLRKKAFDKMLVLPIQTIDQTPHGVMVSRIISDVEQFCEGALMGFSQFFTGILTIVLTLAFILRFHPLLAMIVVGVTPLSLLVSSFIAKRSYKYYQQQTMSRGEMSGLVNETMDGITTIKSFTNEEQRVQEFAKANENFRVAYLKAIFISSISNPATRFVNALVYAGVGITGAFLAIRGKLSIGQLVSTLNYASQYSKPFNEISGVITELQNSIAGAARIFDLLEEAEVEKDAEFSVDLQTCEGEFNLQNIAFSYDKTKAFIENLSMQAKAGQRIAVVGPTGCGKTTLINLILRFYEIDAGQIFLDSREFRTITRDSYVERFGIVLQDTWLMEGSIRDNIKMGRPDASDEEMIQVAKECHAHSFIQQLEHGYDTIITQNGGNLSAGQRQLLCIARVLLKKPQILILDEATSSIDTRTESKVATSLERLMEGRTSFIVAHRLSTIKNADMILVMKDGSIIESGNHRELLERSGFYKKLYQSQFEE